MEKELPQVLVAQLGAREHYSIPRMCQRAGVLSLFYTDFWVSVPRPLAGLAKRFGSPGMQRLIGRWTTDIPMHLVQSYPLASSCWQWRLRRTRGRHAISALHERWGKDFATRVTRELDRVDHTTFFGFSTASLEALAHERRSGGLAVLDEIAPTHMEEEILTVERHRFPGWEPEGETLSKSFLERRENEWDAAHRIIVNSEWTKNALIARGVTPNKIYVVPVAYEGQITGYPRTPRQSEPLRVLWVGTLCLRKGFPYAIDAAKKLEGLPVRFTFAGPSYIDLKCISWPSNSQYMGQVPRINVRRLFESHDVFLLPTLSDGFALTQLEAMAHGLPVIATHNCGDVVQDERSGLRIEAGSAEAIVTAIMRFLDGQITLEDASVHALERVEKFRLDEVWNTLRQVLTPA